MLNTVMDAKLIAQTILNVDRNAFTSDMSWKEQMLEGLVKAGVSVESAYLLMLALHWSNDVVDWAKSITAETFEDDYPDFYRDMQSAMTR